MTEYEIADKLNWLATQTTHPVRGGQLVFDLLGEILAIVGNLDLLEVVGTGPIDVCLYKIKEHEDGYCLNVAWYDAIGRSNKYVDLSLWGNEDSDSEFGTCIFESAPDGCYSKEKVIVRNLKSREDVESFITDLYLTVNNMFAMPDAGMEAFGF